MSKKMRQHLSAPGLLRDARSSFQKIVDHRSSHCRSVSLTDSLMSALAVFGMKYPSLLQFDEAKQDEHVVHNLKTLYGVDSTPCDTTMREIIDPIAPNSLRSAFKRIFARVQRGKALEAFHVDGDRVLVSVDGTGYFQSSEIHCDQCCVKQSRDGKTSYYHQMLGAAIVHPSLKTVLPLCPEAIIKQDGNSKNDCERNAAKRLLTDLRREHPLLKMIVVEDSLASNAPHVSLLKKLKMSFILGVKPGDHGALFDLVDDMESMGGAEIIEVKSEAMTQVYRFINDVPLNEANEKMVVNFLEYWETKNGKTLHFSWVTDISLSEKKIENIMKWGRARWKIENETFNTLKNQGYEFEHNFGHGYQNLSVNFAYLMLLAFLIDQVQELSCQLFQAAKKSRINKRSLWHKLRSLFINLEFNSWQELYEAIIYGHKVSGFTINYNSS